MFDAVTLPSESTKKPDEEISPLAEMITLGTS